MFDLHAKQARFNLSRVIKTWNCNKEFVWYLLLIVNLDSDARFKLTATQAQRLLAPGSDDYDYELRRRRLTHLGGLTRAILKHRTSRRCDAAVNIPIGCASFRKPCWSFVCTCTLERVLTNVWRLDADRDLFSFCRGDWLSGFFPLFPSSATSCITFFFNKKRFWKLKIFSKIWFFHWLKLMESCSRFKRLKTSLKVWQKFNTFHHPNKSSLTRH